MSGDADSVVIVRHVREHDRVGTDPGTCSDGYRPQDLGSRAEHHVPPHMRKAVPGLAFGDAKRYTMVDLRPAFKNGPLADHDADAVNDDDAWPERGPVIDIDRVENLDD